MRRWRSPRRAGRECELTAPQVKRLMAQGLVTSRQLPGGRVEVDAAELQKIAQAAVKRAVVAAS